MSKSAASILVVFGVLCCQLSNSAQALPAASAPTRAETSDVTLVAGGCGIGWHRGPYGGCIRNGYYAPYYAPPVVVERPVVVAPRACPYGYHLGPYGQACIPY